MKNSDAPKTIALFMAALFASSCTHTPKTIETPAFKEWLSISDTAKIVAVLPFTNETKAEDLPVLVRHGFYEHFSTKSFFDVELKEIDAILNVINTTEGKNVDDFTPQELGRLLRCDALVYGSVTKFRRTFLLIYSQMVLETKVRIVSTQTGNELWRHTHYKRFHEGGVPTSPFGVIPATVRTTYGMRKGRRNKEIDAYCKELASCIPEVHYPHPGTIDELWEVQVASFTRKEGASTLSSQLSHHGYKPSLREIKWNDDTWYRIALGPFITREDAVRYQQKLMKEFTTITPLVVKSRDSTTVTQGQAAAETCEIRVVSFTLKEGAQTISAKLSRHGYKPFITTTTTDGAIWYNVMVGPYPSRDEALRHQVQLQEEFTFFSPVIVTSTNSADTIPQGSHGK